MSLSSVIPARSAAAKSPARRRRKRTRGERFIQAGRWTFIGLWLLFCGVPLLILIFQSVSPVTAPADAFGLASKFVLGNYTSVWRLADLGRALLNTVIIDGVSVVGIVVLGSVAAYPLARRRNRTHSTIYNILVASFVLPPALSIVPLYEQLRSLGLLGTYWGLVLAYIGGFFPLATFLYAGFIRAVPRELDEAAMVDGAGPVRIYLRVIMPLLKPVTATVVIGTILPMWNDFFTPLLFLQSSQRETVALAIYNFVQGPSAVNIGDVSVTPWPEIFAGVVITTIPILVLFYALQRHFAASLTRGMLKG